MSLHVFFMFQTSRRAGRFHKQKEQKYCQRKRHKISTAIVSLYLLNDSTIVVKSIRNIPNKFIINITIKLQLKSPQI